MVTIEEFKNLAGSFPESSEEVHFEKGSFRVRKKIFATLDEKKRQVVVKLSEIDQSVFCAFDGTVFYPVKGAWGKKGWTVIELQNVKRDMLMDAIKASYCLVAPKSLSVKIQ
ncbi:MmcQ/YjbR family DNA-binding protein [Negadavirga shengliensis]|uniref:MmcQ/YjbR family DNA-binding protein n=1 Tax=Negadavirga shengliensis TaxID=1389218 RepID=A0ABV9T1K9_9BACT